MILSRKDVKRIHAMVPAAHTVTAEDDGIRIEAGLENGDETIVGQAMRAALALKLDPSQIVDQCVHHEAYSYSTLTQGGGYTNFDVKFLYKPVEQKSA